MELNRTKKILIAFLTFWPILYLLLLISITFVSIFMAGGSEGLEKASSLTSTITYYLHLPTLLLTLGLLVFYIVYLFKAENVRRDKKALWATVLLIGHMISMPVFWYFYIWKIPDSTARDHSNASNKRLQTDTQ